MAAQLSTATSVFGWGGNGDGQLGDETKRTDRHHWSRHHYRGAVAVTVGPRPKNPCP
jgi:alpha-tubulin suppressor-like RCC1 family protein